MKRKANILLMLLVAVALCALCLTACGEAVAHEHTYATEWTHDDDYHWHAATCEHTGKEGDKAVHTFTVQENKVAMCDEDGYTVYACECGASYRVEKKGGHAYDQDVWVYDAQAHWHPTVCGHINQKDNAEAHVFTDSTTCLCGYTLQGNPATDFTFVRSRGGYMITGLSDDGADVTTLSIPSNIGSLPVVGIAKYAFEGNTKLTTVWMANGPTEIQESAFAECSNLQSVSLPESLQTLGSYVFEGCVKLASVKMPTTLATLGDQVFCRCAVLQSIVVPEDLTYMGDNVFLGCSALEEVTLPASLTHIGTQAFALCTALTSVELPENLTVIGMKAFAGSGLTSVTVPDKVTRLGSYAFSDCTALTSAVLSKNIDYTAGDWFSGCAALQSLTLPFVGNNVSAQDAITTAFAWIFGGDDKGDAFTAVTVGTAKYYVPTSLKNVTVLGGSIAANAFNGCTMLETITLAAGVTTATGWNNGCDATVTQLS